MSQGRRLPPSLSNRLAVADGMAGKITRAFKTPQMKEPAARNSSESASSDGSPSLAPSPSPSPQPVKISGKSDNLGKSFDSKGDDSDSGSFSAVVPESALRHEEWKNEGWEDRQHRSAYPESMVARWRPDLATLAQNPMALNSIGQPHVPKDTKNEADFIAAEGIVDYIIDRIPEEILNGTPISKWDSSKPRPKRMKRLPSELLEPMPKCHKDEDFPEIESSYDTESLFEDELSAELKVEEGFDGVEFEPELMPVVAKEEEEEAMELPGPSTSAEKPPVKYLIPAVALQKGPANQAERDLLGVICALCDVTSINVSKPTWFRLILNKCEATLSQLTSIENRRRLQLQQASELQSRLKNRVAVLNAKKRCLVAGGQSTFHGLPVRTGVTRTLAEGRGRPSPAYVNPLTVRRETLSSRGISLFPSDSNEPRLPMPSRAPQMPVRTTAPQMPVRTTAPPLLFKRLRMRDGRIITVPANHSFPQSSGRNPNSTAAIVRPVTKPYFVVKPQQQQRPMQQAPVRRPEDGIPAIELLNDDDEEEEKPPKPVRLQQQPTVTYMTTSAPRPLMTARPQVGFGFMRSKTLPRPGQ